MLMRWEDLEPGDSLKFRKKFIKEINKCYDKGSLLSHNIYSNELTRINRFVEKVFVIRSVKIINRNLNGHKIIEIAIDFKSSYLDWEWVLNEEGLSVYIPMDFSEPPFEIVKLKKED